VKWVVAAGGQPPVDVDEVLDLRHLRRDDDAVVREADLLGQRGRAKCALEHRLDVDVARVHRSAARAFASIIAVSRSWSREPQLTPMRTGLSLATATSTIARKFSSRRLAPTFPGLMRYLASARAQAGCR
jgi:hypothetical protein